MTNPVIAPTVISPGDAVSQRIGRPYPTAQGAADWAADAAFAAANSQPAMPQPPPSGVAPLRPNGAGIGWGNS